MLGMWPGILKAGIGAGMKRSPGLLGAGIGAAVGGAYGAMSDNTSIIGGALTGAAMGGIGGMGYRAAKIGAAMRGAGKTWAQTLHGIGRNAAGTIGNTLGRAYNPIRSTMKAGRGAFAEGYSSARAGDAAESMLGMPFG